MTKKDAFILWFDQVDHNDVGLVGGKNASLGEMHRFLATNGIKVPNGFCVTAHAYRYFVQKTGLDEKIRAELHGLSHHNIHQLVTVGKKIRQLILNTPLPSELVQAIQEAYHHLGIQYGKNPDVAVRSSATAEDLETASFAGQQETFLNIEGATELVTACQKCFASLFTNRAISYRIDQKFDHFKVALSIGVQKMVRSDLAASGVLFTIDTETGFKNAVIINAAYGLGESVVQGSVNPDQFILFKPSLKTGHDALLSKKKGDKKTKVVYAARGQSSTKTVLVNEHDQNQYCISDTEAHQLARWGLTIENHFSIKAQKPVFMDIEWAKDGHTGELCIVQARPETVQSQKNAQFIEEFKIKKKGRELARGESIGQKIGIGNAHVIMDVHGIHAFKKGEVLVTDTTDPDWEPVMKIASAIVTNRGGRTSHAAIVARELGIPAVVGCSTATQTVGTGKKVSVSCAEGETGFVYAGTIRFEKTRINLGVVPPTRTQILLNLADPSQAFAHSFLPVDGVGLCRQEFIISNWIRIHPLALVHFDQLKDAQTKQKIAEQTTGYSDKKKFFVDKLSEGIALIAAAFFPRPVLVRFSDFKSNEYANLIGGHLFEPNEENPMLGFRGASRYYSLEFAPAFALECAAIQKVRKEKGLTNVQVMIPFCRTVNEAHRVMDELKKNGLERGHDLQVFVMCEIPSNVILAHEFARVFDGFSIGSNDLTQLTLGLDRDSQKVAGLYDERNEAVMELIREAISRVKAHNRKIGICGQAPSDFAEFAEFLVKAGIDSISLNPDSVIKTRFLVAGKEAELKHAAKSAR